MIDIHSMEVTLSQEGNTLGTTGEHEEMTVSLETQIPGDRPFIVIKTEGWSFDGGDEAKAIFDSLVEKFTALVQELKGK